ncbi:MAG: hypothetical protein WCE61_05815 [Candidatus Acidiferrum sp.]
MPLKSKLFAGDPALQACLTKDSAHITLHARGHHVSKIQTAIFILEEVSVAPAELRSQTYGPSTAAAILAYKRRRNIVNRAYQTHADNIVGKMTIAELDREMVIAERCPPVALNPLSHPACS